MKNVTNSILDITRMDELSMRDTVVHRIHPLVKLIVTIYYIVCTLSYQPDDIGGVIPMVFYPVVIFMLSDIPIKVFVYKFRIVFPLLIFIGIFNPILNREPVAMIGTVVITQGMISFVTLLAKEVLALAATFLLIATTGIEKICYALTLIKVPNLIVNLILITYRYISLLVNEVGVMTDAYAMRSPRNKGIHFSAWGSFLGGLLLRSMDRANDVYMSMLMRGYTGDFREAVRIKVTKADYLYGIICVTMISLLRITNVSEAVGNLLLGL